MTPTPETRKIGERTYTNDGKRRMCWDCYERATTWQNENGVAWCEQCQGQRAIVALAASEQARQRAETRVELMAQRITFEAAWRVADSERRDYGLACYMLRDLPLSETAGMKDMLWALHNEGGAAKGDWELVRDKWQEAYRAALAQTKPCAHTWVPSYLTTARAWVCFKCGERTEETP